MRQYVIIFCFFCFLYYSFSSMIVCNDCNINNQNSNITSICNNYNNETLKNECYYNINDISSRNIINNTQLLCSIAGLCKVSCCLSNYPEQVHISVTGNPTEMIIMWIQAIPSDYGFVKYFPSNEGNSSLIKSTNVYMNTYTEGGWIGYIYQCKLTNLLPNTKYNYTVGIPFYSLEPYYIFTTPPNTDINSDVSFLAYGDMGDLPQAKEVMMMIYNRIQTDNIDLILHVGDIAYAGGDQSIWDEWMRLMTPIFANLPYMVVEGNHEKDYRFAAYNHRFRNPSYESQSNTTKYYSFDYGNIHFLAISFEDYEDLDNNPLFGKQREWIISDLENANANRDKTPWIIIYVHRPLYCTYENEERCTIEATRYRFQLENIFYDNNVDFVITAHNHNYERTYPVYKKQPTSTNYNNPTAPIYIVVGTAGKTLYSNDWITPAPSWSVEESRIDNYGFSKIISQSNKSLKISWIYADSNTEGDHFIITKDK